MGIFDNVKIFNKDNQNTNSSENIPVNQYRKKILIVEDEHMLSQALSIKLQHEGYDVLIADNGEIGLEMATTQHPNLILLDLTMPVMDGKTMLHKLRQIPENKTLPVFVLSNDGNINNIRETQTYYGVTEFFIKSNISTEELLEKVKDTI